jgi:uncharacterized RDD family membrane protein YckC
LVIGFMYVPVFMVVGFSRAESLRGVKSGADAEATRAATIDVVQEHSLWAYLAIFLIPLLYGTLSEGLVHGTPAKKMLGLAVADGQGNELGFFGALTRNLSKTFISAPLFWFPLVWAVLLTIVGAYTFAAGAVIACLVLSLPFLFALFMPKGRTLHDLVCGSMVVE